MMISVNRIWWALAGALMVSTSSLQAQEVRRLRTLAGDLPKSASVRAVVGKIDTNRIKSGLARPKTVGTPRPDHELPQIKSRGRLKTASMRVGGVRWEDETKVVSSFSGLRATGYLPPDPALSVGPTNLVIATNTDLAGYSKAGEKLFEMPLGPDQANSFFKPFGLQGDLFDPKLVYDGSAKRHVLLVLHRNETKKQSSILLAISDDEDPVGTWNLLKMDSLVKREKESLWVDYATVAVTEDAIVVTGNLYDYEAGDWSGVLYRALPKDDAYAGKPVRWVDVLDTSGDHFTVQLAQGDGGEEFALGASYAFADDLVTFHKLVYTDGNLQVERTEIGVPEAARPPRGIPMRGTDDRIDPCGFRLISSSRQGHRLATLHVMKEPDSDRTSARWYEADLSDFETPTLVQVGSITGTRDSFTSASALAFGSDGSLGFVVSASSDDTYPAVYVTGRLASDPPGSVAGPAELRSSVRHFDAFEEGVERWGDYFSVQADPVEAGLFWAIGETADESGSWVTWIGSFRLR